MTDLSAEEQREVDRILADAGNSSAHVEEGDDDLAVLRRAIELSRLAELAKEV